MRFLERIILGLRYHYKAHLITAGLTVLFTVLGLFLMTNLTVENQAESTFNSRISQLSGTGKESKSGTQDTAPSMQSSQGNSIPDKTAPSDTGKNLAMTTTKKHAVTTHIAKIYKSQARIYNISFWVVVGLFTLTMVIIAFRFAKRNRNETRALMLVGKNPATIAAQAGIESFVTFGATFSVVTLFSLLFTTPILNLIQSLNRSLFIRVVISRIGKSQATIETTLKAMFSKRFTDFTCRSLLMGHDLGGYTLSALAGYSFIFLFGAVVILLTYFTATLWQARIVRQTL